MTLCGLSHVAPWTRRRSPRPGGSLSRGAPGRRERLRGSLLVGDVERVETAHRIADTSDAELARIISARPGAKAEEAELCRRLERRVRLYGRRHLEGDEQVDDLVQRVLLLLVTKLRAGAVQDPARVGSFALGTARNVASEIRRGGRRSDAFEEGRHAGAVGSRPRDPLALDRLAAALAELDERERTVLTMTFYGERSSSEIAQALGLTAGNVRVIRHRAMRRMRILMGVSP